jgi:hypothetical protein
MVHGAKSWSVDEMINTCKTGGFALMWIFFSIFISIYSLYGVIHCTIPNSLTLYITDVDFEALNSGLTPLATAELSPPAWFECIHQSSPVET